MNSLIFLSNELMNPVIQRELRLPLEFITFGMTKGKMYKHFKNKGTFILPPKLSKAWGNTFIYGGLFICKDFDFYARILDAYHVCSLSTMLRNHNQDVQHRVEVEVITIHFQTLDELARLKYREGESIKANTYIGNIKHPKIKIRTKKTTHYRVTSGVDAPHFTQLFRGIST